MPSLEFVTLDVFTNTKFRGNPLAMVLVPAGQKDALTQEQRQSIAREFNLSETVFLHQPTDASSTTREINIHTIEQEVPFAGHPTIGTTYYILQHLGFVQVDTLFLKAGPFRIARATSPSGHVTAEIAHDVHLHAQTLRSVLPSQSNSVHINAALSEDPAIRNAELDAPVFSVVKGMTFLLVELPSLDHLAKVGESKRLDFGKLSGVFDAGPWANTFACRYYYVPQGDSSWGTTPVERYRTRMVELAFEDPATGSAASALCSYLAMKREADEVRFEITQGVEMGRQSEIVVEVVSSKEAAGGRAIKQVRLGGSAVVVMKGSIEV